MLAHSSLVQRICGGGTGQSSSWWALLLRGCPPTWLDETIWTDCDTSGMLFKMFSICRFRYRMSTSSTRWCRFEELLKLDEQSSLRFTAEVKCPPVPACTCIFNWCWFV